MLEHAHSLRYYLEPRVVEDAAPVVAPSEYIGTNSTSEQQLSGSRFSSDDSEDSDASIEDGDEDGEGEGPGQPWHQQEEEGTALSRCVADFLSNSADTTLLLLGEVGHAPALYLAAFPACAHSRCRTMDC